MWQKIKKFFKVLFATKIELILEDRTIRLFVNDEIVPLQIVYGGEFLIEQSGDFAERLVNELRRVIKLKTRFILVKPILLVILKGKPETVNSEIIFKIITNGIQCRELFIIRWSEAEQRIGKSLEEACREFPRWLKDLRFIKNVQA